MAHLDTQGAGQPSDPVAYLSTVIIYTTRMAALAEFYRQGLGLEPPQATGEDHLGFPLPNVYLGFDQVDEPIGTGPSAVSVWFQVDDLDAAFERFVALGGAVRYPPTTRPWGARLAAVYDLDGNILGLAQRGTVPE